MRLRVGAGASRRRGEGEVGDAVTDGLQREAVATALPLLGEGAGEEEDGDVAGWRGRGDGVQLQLVASGQGLRGVAEVLGMGEQGGRGWLTAPVAEEKGNGGGAELRKQTAAARLLYAREARAWRAAAAPGRPCFGKDTRRSSASVPRRQRARGECRGAVARVLGQEASWAARGWKGDGAGWAGSRAEAGSWAAGGGGDRGASGWASGRGEAGQKERGKRLAGPAVKNRGKEKSQPKKEEGFPHSIYRILR